MLSGYRGNSSASSPQASNKAILATVAGGSPFADLVVEDSLTLEFIADNTFLLVSDTGVVFSDSVLHYNPNSHVYTQEAGAMRIPGSGGSAASPTFSFHNDTNTGLFRPAEDVIALSCGGNEFFRIDGPAGIISFSNQTSGPGAGGGTLLNAPSAGNPDFWVPLMVNGTQYWIPAWST